MHRVIPSVLAALATFCGSAALAQGTDPYNRGIDPLSLRYEPSPSGGGGTGHQIAGELILDTDGAVGRDLGCTLSVFVNGALAAPPTVINIQTSPTGQAWGCNPTFCDNCRGWCRNSYNFLCICIVINLRPGLPEIPGFALEVPELHQGDFVMVRADPLPASLPEIDLSDDQAGFVVGPPCRGDFNGDGSLNSQDFFDFVTTFFAFGPSADFNHDGAINSQDYFDFITAFFAGC